MTQRGHGQRLRPDLEQKLADLVAHPDLVEQVAQLDGVLDGQRFFLLHLLGNAHQALGGAFFGQESRQEFLELLQHQLEHAASGFRVLLDHLHDPADFGLHGAALHTAGVETQNARAHAVDQLPGRMLQGAEELGLVQRHAQHRHLQARKPDPHPGRNALLGQNGLKHQRHDFDGGLFGDGSRLFLQLGASLPDFPGQLLHPAGRHQPGTGDIGLRVFSRIPGERLRQFRGGWPAFGLIKVGPAIQEQPTQLPQHALRALARAGQRRGRRHQPRLIGEGAARVALPPRCVATGFAPCRVPRGTR